MKVPLAMRMFKQDLRAELRHFAATAGPVAASQANATADYLQAGSQIFLDCLLLTEPILSAADACLTSLRDGFAYFQAWRSEWERRVGVAFTAAPHRTALGDLKNEFLSALSWTELQVSHTLLCVTSAHFNAGQLRWVFEVRTILL